ncbi:hypothetical protein UFOVP83_45 [uncultured Caudovirales phage]|uniref:Uncharacterized protein n=1 Tax=uncultured Caudovirales phage TaxID=2100421 RepID=A0A6J5TER8_9CAUD|nr:hypothetical protein UFOVP83_45 [uncultured Caudovirales phage]
MLFTVDFTEEQVSYLRSLVAMDVIDRNREIRSPLFSSYGPSMQANTHEELRIGSTIMGMLPVKKINAFA